MRGSRVVLAVVGVLAVAEIALLAWLGQLIGVWWTLLILVVGGVVGAGGELAEVGVALARGAVGEGLVEPLQRELPGGAPRRRQLVDLGLARPQR